MKRFLLLLVAVFISSPTQAADTTKPNIIFIMADDMGWGQTSYNQHPVLKTPNLDAMAANGLRFDRFYAGNPVCSPTRATVLTGRSNDRTGVLSHGYALRLQENTLAQALQKVGYATGHFGKWHLNGYKGPGAPILAQDPRSPAAFGFDTYVSATNFIDMDPYLGRNGVPEKFEGDSSEIIVAEALKYLEVQHKANKPFFTVIWYGTPHSPFKAVDADKATFSELDTASATHYGELVAMDRSIGTLRQKLRDLGIADNTLVVFNSDNGGLPGITPSTTGGLRGNKGMVFEGGLRVPGIMEWPAVIKPRITKHPVGTVDLFPTVADIVGLPDSSFIQPLDGVSLKPLLSAEVGPRSKPLPFRFGSKAAFIGDRYKLLTQDVSGADFELYDLQADPNEKQDLRATQPAVFEAMKKELLAWNETVEASFAGKDYPEGKVTPADPEPVNWWEAAPYLSYLPEWKSYWAYDSYMNRVEGKAKGKGGKKAKKK
jgi:arylsulfatase A-like enzyme